MTTPTPSAWAVERAKAFRETHLLDVSLAACVGGKLGGDSLREACDLAQEAFAVALDEASATSAGLLRRAHRHGFNAYAGPANKAELKGNIADEKEAWQEFAEAIRAKGGTT